MSRERGVTQVSGRELSWFRRCAPIAVCGGLLVLYLSAPTKVYYWDGIAFAQNVESADGFDDPRLIHPNHLVYNLLGYAAYQLVSRGGDAQVRALYILQTINSIVSVIAAGVLFGVLQRAFGSYTLSMPLMILFGLSATWWRFSTDANSYVISVCLLLVCFWILMAGGRPRPLATAAVHAGSMLFHQLAVLAYPAIVVTLYVAARRSGKGPWRVAVTYSVVATILAVGSYYGGYVVQQRQASIGGFLTWLTSYAANAAFTFDLSESVPLVLRGHVRLFLGGRLSDVIAGLDWRMGVGVAVLGGCLVMLTRRLSGLLGELRDAFRVAAEEGWSRIDVVAAVAWIVPYVLFLTVWLPNNTFYRLFYLPGLLLLFGALVAMRRERYGGTGRRRLLLLSLCIGAFNWSFYILPYSKIEANRPAKLAQEMPAHWPADTVVYFDIYTSDNWTFHYFNPQSEWRLLPEDFEVFETTVEALGAEGRSVWLDTTAIDRLTTLGGEAGEWLGTRSDVVEESLVDDRHRIVFRRVGG